MTTQLSTARGVYTLSPAAPVERDSDWLNLALVVASIDGIERVGFRCRIARRLLAMTDSSDADTLVTRLQPWIEREFERTREAALKSIRSERKLLEIIFDSEHRGPF